MATLVVYSAFSAYAWGKHTTYSIARSTCTSGTETAVTIYVGQQWYSPDFTCWEGAVRYDTSALGSSSTVISVKEELYLSNDNTTTNYTEEVRTGNTFTTWETVWIAGASLGDYTLISSKSVSPNAGYNEFPSSDAFIASINKIGSTYTHHSSDRHRAGTQPSGNEVVIWYGDLQTGTDYDPKLTIEYTLPPSGFFMFF